jgi:hypothetical protein
LEEIQRLSQKLNNQNLRSLLVVFGNKRIEYFLEENIIIKEFRLATDPVNVAEDDTDLYSDDKNPKKRKIANKIVDYALGKKKLTGEKLKIKRSRLKHKIIMSGDSRRNRKKLVKSKLEYSNYSELKEEESSEEKEDKSLIKRKDIDDDEGDGEGIKLHDNSRIKESSKTNSSSSSTSPEETSHDNSSNCSNGDNKNSSISIILLLKTIITSFIFI